MIFGVGLAALWAAEALETVAMLTKPLAFDVARLAIHKRSLQQALAVCQIENGGIQIWT
jgi:hypothetical protein